MIREFIFWLYFTTNEFDLPLIVEWAFRLGVIAFVVMLIVMTVAVFSGGLYDMGDIITVALATALVTVLVVMLVPILLVPVFWAVGL